VDRPLAVRKGRRGGRKDGKIRGETEKRQEIWVTGEERTQVEGNPVGPIMYQSQHLSVCSLRAS